MGTEFDPHIQFQTTQTNRQAGANPDALKTHLDQKRGDQVTASHFSIKGNADKKQNAFFSMLQYAWSSTKSSISNFSTNIAWMSSLSSLLQALGKKQANQANTGSSPAADKSADPREMMRGVFDELRKNQEAFTKNPTQSDSNLSWSSSKTRADEEPSSSNSQPARPQATQAKSFDPNYSPPPREQSAKTQSSQARPFNPNNSTKVGVQNLINQCHDTNMTPEQTYNRIMTALEKEEIPVNGMQDFVQRVDPELLTGLALIYGKNEAYEVMHDLMTSCLNATITGTSVANKYKMQHNAELSEMLCTELTDNLYRMASPDPHLDINNMINSMGREQTKAHLTTYLTDRGISEAIAAEVLSFIDFVHVPDPRQYKSDFINIIKDLGYKGDENPKFSELNKIYRNMSRELHPDKAPENAAKMAELSLAWRTYKEQMGSEDPEYLKNLDEKYS